MRSRYARFSAVLYAGGCVRRSRNAARGSRGQKTTAATHAKVRDRKALRAYLDALWIAGGGTGPLSINALARGLSFGGVRVSQSSLSRALSGRRPGVSRYTYARLKVAPHLFMTTSELANGGMRTWQELLDKALCQPARPRSLPFTIQDLEIREASPAEIAALERSRRGNGAVHLTAAGAVRVPLEQWGFADARDFDIARLALAPDVAALLASEGTSDGRVSRGTLILVKRPHRRRSPHGSGQ